MPQPPLAGLRVLLTRPAGDGAEAWAAAFAEAGAEPVVYPTVTFAPPTSWQPLDEALSRFGSYDWVIFTSQTTVAFVVDRLAKRRLPDRPPPRMAAVGKATATSIVAAGGAVALTPTDERQEGLVDALGPLPAGTKVFLPLAEGARSFLAEALRARGCLVDAITVYRTTPIADGPPCPAFDVATFASPSALRAFVARGGTATLAGKTVAVIGPTTADEARAHGSVPLVAARPTVEALIVAIAQAHPGQGDR
jgi:uroporphyrinogen-III synthase